MTLSTRLRRMEARLTAREHAAVLLRRWKGGSPADVDLLDLPGVPASLRVECLPMVQRFVFAYELLTNWQSHLQDRIALAQALLAHLESELNWQAHVEGLSALLLKQGVNPPPFTGRAEPGVLRLELVDSIALCWRELGACNEALETLSQDYGEDAAHPTLRAFLEAHRDDVIALRNALGDLETEVELAEPLDTDREFFQDMLEALPSIDAAR